MTTESGLVRAVPTTIITGFLGVGKTSAILDLLRSRPGNERWAVLVNEFGQIGVDGSLFQGLLAESDSVFVTEVPGGCMCCAAGVPMKVALNRLLAKSRPHRLLIEPTGLGHPREVLEVLSSEHFGDVLSVQQTLTLVDARKLSDLRYTSHDTFNQQIAIADTVIGNKQDLYQEGDRERLVAYVRHHGQAHAEVMFTEHGKLKLSVLQATDDARHDILQHQEEVTGLPHTDTSGSQHHHTGATNAAEGYVSIGWHYSADRVFRHDELYSLLASLQVERMKAVVITDKGMFGYNLTSDGLTEVMLDKAEESRIEIIATKLEGDFESRLLSCLIS